MADFIVASILELLKTTINKAKNEARLLLGVETEIKKLERNLNLIRAVLEDAEKKKFKPENKLLKLWLDSLKEACLDMEDALDRWKIGMELDDDEDAVEMARAKLWNKVCGFLSCFSPPRLTSRHDVALNIRDINEKLDEIDEDRNRYQLETREVNEHSTWRETSSFVDESTIVGRAKEKNKILSHFWGGRNNIFEDGNVKTISLVGMGGLGKTTMAQLVYNDQTVREHFRDAVIWVCVSDIFNEKKVAKSIIQGLEKISSFAAQGLETDTWQVLLERISSSIKKTKFFLVLDDVWGGNSDIWEQLIACFKQCAEGSRILVTTRKVDVAVMMGSSPYEIINLKELSDELCWSIIKQRALARRYYDKRNLEEIGKKIAVRCKGLPLAAKALGSLLRSKTSRREWESVLNSEIWDLEMVDEEVFAPLLLSYYDLPLKVRRCFLFCVIYPKDYEIPVNDLINHWMSQGYLGFDDPDLESEGQNCFNILANRSFFQDFERGFGPLANQRRIVHCKMHDLVHDFAKYLVEKEFITEVIQRDDPRSSFRLEKCRHLTLWLEKSSSFPSSVSGARTLRSLLILNQRGNERQSGLDGLPSLLEQSRFLRLLDLNDLPLECLDKLLIGAGKLNHLRQLRLRSGSIRQLHKAISNLCNLIILDLNGCRGLTELPVWISKLKKLRFLDTRHCVGLKVYPKGVRQLTSLRCLLGAFVKVDCNDDQEFSIADLAMLKHLRTVSLDWLRGDIVNVDEVKKVQLPDLQDLWIQKDSFPEGGLRLFLQALRPQLPSNAKIEFSSSN